MNCNQMQWKVCMVMAWGDGKYYRSMDTIEVMDIETLQCITASRSISKIYQHCMHPFVRI